MLSQKFFDFVLIVGGREFAQYFLLDDYILVEPGQKEIMFLNHMAR